ncbi:unnamed protein product [Didymodactylos carnosus]|uniref:Uncharacterized protein n=1 Tax=Didymodactylos carnosus TaxID=1234261 RepID=A0A815CMQ1_9BILA|nr:unnamed protein product [Didymodactylos carnosus]CAF4086109.1 unnamed protein product [Didymodactylos carnosus]
MDELIIPVGELDKVSAAGTVFVYHGVKHSHSYVSQACTVNIVKKIFPDCTSGHNISCGKTKSHEICCNVLGVKRGLIGFIEQATETAIGIKNMLKGVLTENDVDLKKIVSLGANNTNMNYGCNHSVYFFQSHDGQCVLYFLQNILFDLQRSNLQLQRTNTTIVDLLRIIGSLVTSLQRRIDTNYFGFKSKQILNELPKEKKDALSKSFLTYIQRIIQYITNYFDQNRELYEAVSFLSKTDIDNIEFDCLINCIFALIVDGVELDLLFIDYNEILSTLKIIKRSGRSLRDLTLVLPSGVKNDPTVEN